MLETMDLVQLVGQFEHCLHKVLLDHIMHHQQVEMVCLVHLDLVQHQQQQQTSSILSTHELVQSEERDEIIHQTHRLVVEVERLGQIRLVFHTIKRFSNSSKQCLQEVLQQSFTTHCLVQLDEVVDLLDQMVLDEVVEVVDEMVVL